MKKIFSILSLGILLFGNIAQCFANSSYTNEELGNIMLDFLNAEIKNNNAITDIQESNKLKTKGTNAKGEDEIELIGGNNHIVWNKTKGLITVYSLDFSYGATIQDKNIGAENIGDTGDYFMWGGYKIEDLNNINYEARKDSDWTAIDDINEQNKGYDNEKHQATQVELRKGNCGEGFHIPSKGEFENIEKLFMQTNCTYMNCSLNIKESLKFPRPGYISRIGENQGEISFNGYDIYRVSGTAFGGLGSLGIQLEGFTKEDERGVNSLGTVIRCFKDNFIPYTMKVTYNPNGGAFSGMEVNQTKKYKYTADENGINPIYNIQIPDRISEDLSQQSGWMFAGWYTKDGSNGDWGEEFDPYKQNANIVYAKWLPFNDLKIYFGELLYTIMDRNLGAEEISEGNIYDNNENYKQYGFYYQRGNNYGFLKNDQINIHTGELLINQGDENNPWGPNNYYYHNMFVERNTYPRNWDNEGNNNLRGGEDKKSKDEDKKGPCPKGYHIPNIYERQNILTNLSNEKYNNSQYNGISIGKFITNKLKLPYAASYSKYNNVNNCKGCDSSYWSSTPKSTGNGYKIIIYDGNYIDDYGASKAELNPIRCFKNYPTKKLTITNNGEILKEYNFRETDAITEEYYIDAPIKDNADFEGRYIKDTNEIFTFGENSYIKENTILYPKYKCKIGYTESEDGNICTRVKVEFDANGGKFNNNENTYNVEISDFKENITVTKISHTPNFKDNGEFTDKSIDGLYTGNNGIIYYQPSYIDIVKIPGIDKLNVNIRYANTFCNNNAFIYILTGEYSEYRGEIPYAIINNKLPNQSTTNETGFIVQGDSVTFIKFSGCPEYGRYGTVKGNLTKEYSNYAENAFDNIPELFKKGYNFKGRYYTGLVEKFNPETVSTGEIINVYAKWEPHHYTIHFNTGDIEDINATYGEEIILQSLTKEGYTFKGWQAEDGTLYKNSIPEGTGATAEDGVTVTLTAQWEIIQGQNKQTASAGGGTTITKTKQETKSSEQEHNSADTKKETSNTNSKEKAKSNTTNSVEEKIQTISPKSLTRGELAVFSNILLDIFPKLTENKKNVNEVCTEYTDYQEFSSKEQKAVSKLCRLAIMGINEDDKTPLETFGVHNLSTNEEFIKVVNRMTDKYSEEELKDLKSALSSLEENKEENLSFGTVVNIFKKVKNLFE